MYDSNSHQLGEIKVNLIKVHDHQVHRLWSIKVKKFLASVRLCILITASEKSKEISQMEYGFSIFQSKGKAYHMDFLSWFSFPTLGVCCFTYSQRTRAPVT